MFTLILKMYIVQRLNRKDEKLVDVICESLKTAYDPTISKFFVHQDPGFKRFFNSALTHPSYASYYAFDTTSRELKAFACFQIIGDIIFLKHIVVDNKQRGSKIGTKLLYYGLDDIYRTNHKQQHTFQLHVFEKNSKALSWYLSIGLKIVDCTYWYDLSQTFKSRTNQEDKLSPDFRTSTDTFGFVQLHHKELYVGTLLAQKTLIIKNPKFLDKTELLTPLIQEYNVKSVGFVSDEERPFKLVDKALLMSIPISLIDMM